MYTHFQCLHSYANRRAKMEGKGRHVDWRARANAHLAGRPAVAVAVHWVLLCFCTRRHVGKKRAVPPVRRNGGTGMTNRDKETQEAGRHEAEDCNATIQACIKDAVSLIIDTDDSSIYIHVILDVRELQLCICMCVFIVYVCVYV